MTSALNSTSNNINNPMKLAAPKVGVLNTPPKTRGVSQDTLEIVNAKTPKELKNAGIKKKKSPIKILCALYLGVVGISSVVA